MRSNNYASAFLCNYSNISTKKLSIIIMSNFRSHNTDMTIIFSYVETIIHRNISTEQKGADLEFYEIDPDSIYDKKYEGFKIYTPDDMLAKDYERISYEMKDAEKRPPTRDEVKILTEAYSRECLKKNKKKLTSSELRILKSEVGLDNIEILDKSWLDEN